VAGATDNNQIEVDAPRIQVDATSEVSRREHSRREHSRRERGLVCDRHS